MGRLANVLDLLYPAEELEGAACRGLPAHQADLFHGSPRQQRLAIEAYCETCPVLLECRGVAKKLGKDGTRGAVWGGQTPADRSAPPSHASAGQSTRKGGYSSSTYRPGGTSQYRGVSWSSRDSAWHAYLRTGKSTKFLGAFPATPEGERQAAKVWDKAALEYRGPGTYLNFPEEV